MKCPFCKADDTAVVDSRLSDDGDSVRRRRQCESCDKRFTTYERVELSMPMVVKSSGHRVGYDREKIRTGFTRALHKRPVPTEYVEQAINRHDRRDGDARTEKNGRCGLYPLCLGVRRLPACG